MPSEFKIALFWLAVWFSVKLLQRNPDSLLSKLAFSWNGPFPVAGEKRSAFYFRQVRYALGWLIELLFVSAALVIAAWLVPAVKAAETFLIFCSFALTVGVGMSVLGAFLAALVSAKARLWGPDPEFVLAVEPEETKHENDD